MGIVIIIICAQLERRVHLGIVARIVAIGFAKGPGIQERTLNSGGVAFRWVRNLCILQTLPDIPY